MIAFLFERAKLQTVSQAVEGITCYWQAHSPLKKAEVKRDFIMAKRSNMLPTITDFW